jgi:hypothetical protein
MMDMGSARVLLGQQVFAHIVKPMSLAVSKLHFHKKRGYGSQQEMTLLLGSLYPFVALAPMMILTRAANS